MINLVHKAILRFRYAFKGILAAIKTDTSFRIQFFGGFTFVLLFTYFMWPLTLLEISGLIFAWFLVLITELQNSAFESALDRLHPEHHQEIGKSKDMAAGSVLLAAIFALFIVIAITVST